MRHPQVNAIGLGVPFLCFLLSGEVQEALTAFPPGPSVWCWAFVNGIWDALCERVPGTSFWIEMRTGVSFASVEANHRAGELLVLCSHRVHVLLPSCPRLLAGSSVARLSIPWSWCHASQGQEVVLSLWSPRKARQEGGPSGRCRTP